MLLDDTQEDLIWDKVYSKLKFQPSCADVNHSMTSNVPFEIDGNFAVYAIDKMTDNQIEAMEKIILDVFISLTETDKRIYALDWQHSSFLYNPRNPEEQKTFWQEDKRYLHNGYYAYFPTFYPNGDYYFFIEETFKFGFLGHPWRKEIWIFGDCLIEKIEHIYSSLGWEKLK